MVKKTFILYETIKKIVYLLKSEAGMYSENNK